MKYRVYANERWTFNATYDMLTAMGLSPHPTNMDEIKTGIYTRFE